VVEQFREVSWLPSKNSRKNPSETEMSKKKNWRPTDSKIKSSKNSQQKKEERERGERNNPGGWVVEKNKRTWKRQVAQAGICRQM